MSKKTRAPTRAKQAENQPANLLSLQKQNIRDSTRFYLELTVCLFAFMVGISAIWKPSPRMIICLPIGAFAIAILFCLWKTLQRFRIYRLMKSIHSDEEAAITLRCRNFRTLEDRKTRIEMTLLGLIFHGEDGQKFYYVYPKGSNVSPDIITVLNKKVLDQEVQLLCYRGTTIVKEFDL